MSRVIPYPRPGEKVTADLVRRILDLIRETTPIAGPNIRTVRTAHGTHISTIPVSGKENGARDLGCWRLVVKSNGGEPFLTVENRFYSCGELTKQMDEMTEINLGEFINQGELADGEEYTSDDRPFIALKAAACPDEDTGSFSDPEIVAFKTFSEMAEEQRNTAFVIRPLYKLSHYGAVVVDFRTMPHMQLVEVI